MRKRRAGPVCSSTGAISTFMSLSVATRLRREQPRRPYPGAPYGRCPGLSGSRRVTSRTRPVLTPRRCGDMSVEPYGADEESAAVLRTVGRVIKMCREREGMTQAGLGTAIRYSEEQVSSVERGRRAPAEEFL